MSTLGMKKRYRITEYSVIVCILVVKIWCGFAGLAFSMLVGGTINTLVDLALCAYLVLNMFRGNNGTDQSPRAFSLIYVWVTFAVIYSLIFLLARESLPPVSILGVVTLPKQIYNTIFTTMYLVALILATKNMSRDERRMVSNLLLAVFFAVAMANLLVTIFNPDMIKTEGYNEEGSLFSLGYTGAYNTMLVTPILLYKLGGAKNKIPFAIFLACNLISVLFGGYFIAILGTLIALLIYWILGTNNKLVMVLLITVVVVSMVALIVSGALADFTRYLADNIGIGVIQDRLDDIARYLSGDTNVQEGDTTFRILIYQDTFNSFLEHPLFGNFILGIYNCQRDHSTILDLLAVGGIGLAGLFFAVISFGYRFAASFIKDKRAKRALITMVAAYLFVALFNPVLTYQALGMLLVVAPIIMGGEAPDENS